MTAEHRRYVVIEGPIGVGKTSLARRLAERLGGELMLERPEQNPFLADFYREPRRYALPTQLHYLLQRAQLVEEYRQADLFRRACIADFMIDKDRLFAELTLDAAELALYRQVYAHLAVDAPRPDLVIYLQAPVPVLRRRIAARGIAHEQRIEDDYLERLSAAYTRFFHDYDGGALLAVNTDALDLVDDEADFAAIVAKIDGIRCGRHYFNRSSFPL